MGTKFKNENLTYPLHQYYKTFDQYEKLFDLLKNSLKTFKEIAEELNLRESTVKKINYGKLQFQKDIDYPIRKTSSIKAKADLIKDLLINSELSGEEIKKIAKCSGQTINRINLGETHFDSKLNYPLR
jgi:hypothetical protein